jgi:hypothetical protein
MLIAGALALGVGVLTALPSSLAAAAAASASTGRAAPVAQVRLPAWPGCRYAGRGPLRALARCSPFSNVADANPDVGGTLVGVSADSSSDAWAVGNYSTSAVPYGAFIARWNGTRWAKVASPNPGLADGSSLLGVSALSPADAWAVGTYTPSAGAAGALILRWDGTRWRQVPGPSGGDPELFAVSAVSASDAWAVGIYSTNKVKPFLVHWNGTRWFQVPAPSPGYGAVLNAVSARSATDAWAVGYYAANASGQLRPLTLHWNGTRWTSVPIPVPPSATGDTGLLGVSTLSADDAWATGYDGNGKSASALLLHWNGTRWVRIPIPNPPKPPPGWRLLTVLSAVSAGCPADVMVTGWHETIDPGDDTSFTAFALRWNGSKWTQLPSPESASSLQLYGTSVVSAKDAWVVGSSTPGIGATQSLVLRWNGARWTQIPSPY